MVFESRVNVRREVVLHEIREEADEVGAARFWHNARGPLRRAAPA
jgi:hypothetical protein